MRSLQFEDPRLLVTNAQDLSLSGAAVASLMHAVLEKGLPFRFRARGWSMVPFIWDGDVITVAPFGHSPPAIGEVVAFGRPLGGNLLVHRLLARRDRLWLIRGDGVLERPDGYIPADDLLGRVVGIEHNGKGHALGLGPERYVVAWLSRVGLMAPLSARLVPLLRRLLQHWR